MQLQYISIGALIGEAGGDPWAINQSLQKGRPSQIGDLAEAFHTAGRSTTESSTAFAEARQRFEASWNRENGEHPINDSAEVQRVTKALGAQSVQLPKIGADLKNVAAALAEAQRTGGARISTLESQLQQLDSEIGQGLELEKDPHLTAAQRSALDEQISRLQQHAIDDTKSALGQLESLRNGYSDHLRNSLATLHAEGDDQPHPQNQDVDYVTGDHTDDEPWRYPWDPPPPPDSAPGGGRWDPDYQHPYEGGPGGGPPMGPFSVPQPWHRDVYPPVTGPTSGPQDMAPTTPNGWGVKPAITAQEQYRFRLVGEHFSGAADHVRWVQSDGKWYRAQWIDYDFQAEHVILPQGNTGLTGGLPQFPIGLQEWHPISIKGIYAAQAHNPLLTMYVPDICGQPYVLSSKVPAISRG